MKINKIKKSQNTSQNSLLEIEKKRNFILDNFKNKRKIEAEPRFINIMLIKYSVK